MVDTRANPTTGLLEVKHPDLNIWVQAIAPLLIAGGWKVSLDTAQATLLSALKGNSDALLAALQASNLTTDQIKTLIGNIQSGELNAIKLLLTDLKTLDTGLANNIDYLKTSIGQQGGTTLAALISSLDAKLTTVLTGLNSILTNQASMLTNQAADQTVFQRTNITSCTITNLSMVSAQTEYSFTFPIGTKRYAFKCRNDANRNDATGAIRYSWVTGKVAGGASGIGVDSYDVLPVGAEEISTDYFDVARTIYFASATAGVVLSVRRWV